jgi:hypothetical protein
MNESAPWLERELARQLAPVAAPASLWKRIEEPRERSRPRASLRWIAWPAAAIVTLIACAGLLRTIDRSRDSEFRSSDFGAIRSWVKARADIDIDLPEGSAVENALVRLSGVRLIRVKGLRVAALDYRVGDNAVTLFVSGKPPAPVVNTVASRHLFSDVSSRENTRLVSWNMRNQNYTIAFSGPGDAHSACLLCHANVPGMITMN